MRDSNQTLRWNRSAREAYGHDIEFESHSPDYPVWILVAFALGVILGVMIGGVAP